HAIAERLGGEAAEDDRVRRTDARAGEHGDRGLRDHGQVDADPVAGPDAEALQGVREAADLAVEAVIREHAPLARLALPDEGRLVAPRAGQVAVEAVVGDVELAADEPLRERRLPVEDALEGRHPAQQSGHLAPEALR